jgi:exodeoxyribonuclease-5
MLGTIKSIEDNDDDTKFAHIEFDDEDATYKGYILSEQFNNKESLNFTNKRHRTLKSDLFDFGYALTVHKAQGSQASNVILFEERFAKMDDETWRRWLYTGVTRAQDKLVIVGS